MFNVNLYQQNTTTCPEYGSSVTYIANLTGFGSIEVNHASCEGSFCSATFEPLSSENIVEYELTLLAMNDINSGVLVHYPTKISELVNIIKSCGVVPYYTSIHK